MLTHSFASSPHNHDHLYPNEGTCVWSSYKSDKFNFRSSCWAHDNCYYAISDHRTHCAKKFWKCNDYFRYTLELECEAKSSKACTKNNCKDIADFMVSTVESFVPKYEKDLKCDANTDPDPQIVVSQHGTYLRAYGNGGKGDGTVDQAPEPKGYEQWVVQKMDDARFVDGTGKVALFNIWHGLYLRGGGESGRTAEVDMVPWIQSHELWEMVKEKDGKVRFKHVETGKYLRAMKDSKEMNLSTYEGSWELWQIRTGKDY